MDGNPTRLNDVRSSEILAPATQTLAIVLASPHSGRDYAADLVADTGLDMATLRRSEDSFVDEIFAFGPDMGVPLLRALFPRAFIDPNREPYELDPQMFEDALPDHVNRHSNRVAAGLGTIARVVATGEEIYRRKLRFTEAEQRIRHHYRPYHEALERLVAETQARFNRCTLIDCHSMPSVGSVVDRDPGHRRVDIVLGDAFGTACAPAVTATAERVLRDLGYAVARNAPYSGGFTTRHYGRPQEGVHALQIEINRRLYMDEATYEPTSYLPTLSSHMRQVVAALGRLDDALLTASRRAAE